MEGARRLQDAPRFSKLPLSVPRACVWDDSADMRTKVRMAQESIKVRGFVHCACEGVWPRA